MIDLSVVLEAAAALLAALITTFLIPWLRSRLTQSRLSLLQAVLETAVAAAEQYYGAGEGERKKIFVQNYLEENGYTVDDTAIEAAVYRLKEAAGC